jgi:hypothetical protein
VIAKAVPARISTHPRTGQPGRDRHYARALAMDDNYKSSYAA